MNRIPPFRLFLFGVCVALSFSAGVGRAGDAAPLPEHLLEAFRVRALGPANMGGRVTDVAAVESKPATLFVATASGGLWKTHNNGTTWTPVFDNEEVASIGDVAVAPSDPNIVWAGTGESNPRNSVSWGNGVYKSTDGGKTWQNMGLRTSAHVGRVVIHPKDPNVVYVAALGRLWGPNQERGLYKTRDGGKTWERVQYVNEDTGFIDLVMDPSNPETLYTAAYQCRRDGFSGGNPAVQTGPGSGLFKTTDGGKTWTRMARGLPDRPLGRCGIAVYAKDPRIVYAVIQTDKTACTVTGQPAKANDQIDGGGVFRSEDKGETWTKLNDLCPRPFYYGQVRIDPNDDQRIYVLGNTLHISNDGGKTFQEVGAKIHPDHHALWIDPRDSDHLVLGGDGGVYFSYDRGETWEHVNNLPIGQFYAAAVDMRKPYRIYGGLQDNGTWYGPSATRRRDGIVPADWEPLLGADGFRCQIDPADPDTIFAETQYGRPYRIDLRTGEITDVRPRPPKGSAEYRFNWNAPLLLSPHDPRVVYFGGNHLFRSDKRGERWEVISPDLTRGKPGPSANAGHTLTAIAESPLKPGLLFVGSDDGRVHVSRNGGAAWTEVSGHLPDLPPERWITCIECSRFAEGTAYLTIDRHRNDDLKPYVFKTEDYGESWRRVTQQLPEAGPVHVLREDLRNKDLLFAGTEFGLFVSADGGEHWQRLRAGMPTVAVHDLVIHPREREMVVATHGRGIYVLDVAVLQELSPDVRKSTAHLFDVKPALRFQVRNPRTWSGFKTFVAANPSYGAVIHYALGDTPSAPVHITITDAGGEKVAEWQEKKGVGLHQLQWNLRLPSKNKEEKEGPPAPPGEYVIQLRVGEQVITKKLRVEAEE